MAVKSLRPDLQDQLPVVGLMLASSCFGRKVCQTPPCACAQSLIDAVTNLEIERLQAAKRAALAIADERSKENVALRAENKALKKQVEKLRNALAPFACLSVKELRPGDTNRARRALQ